MKRRFPEVGALYERVRRPAMMITAGLALVAPSAGMMVRGEPWGLERAAAAPRAEQMAMASPAVPTAAVVAARPVEDAEREADATIEGLARRYGVSVSLAREIYAAAQRNGIDPKVAFGLVRTESSFRRTAVSHVGAIGYTQVLPSTARWIAPGTSRRDLFDTRTNLNVGFRYLRYLIGKYDGNLRLALTAYNRGPGTVDRILARGGNPDNGYASKVLRG
ncbi:MAG TPA: lytic transglycosylase domain-containing protein [Longimicrobiales bacterium]